MCLLLNLQNSFTNIFSTQKLPVVIIIFRVACISLHCRIPYSALLEAAYKDRYFTVRYRTVDESEENCMTSYTVKTPCHKLALSMFRMLTEDHTFFYHERVGDRVLNHHMALTWRELMRRTFVPGTLITRRYHFDIVRTKMEAYSQAWEILHQLQGTGPIVSSSSSNSDHGYVVCAYNIVAQWTCIIYSSTD